jgi:hypothetical protein
VPGVERGEALGHPPGTIFPERLEPLHSWLPLIAQTKRGRNDAFDRSAAVMRVLDYMLEFVDAFRTRTTRTTP